ncbi:hypothetical protein V5799_019024 [Amblyomma americanum]|uniref:HMG box domain-containing protein n=1 Tax=Amblyomma americanum TaxID=6943 RepID=A0AAQ4EYH0_AMBAM
MPLDGTGTDSSPPESSVSPLIQDNTSEDHHVSEGIAQPLDFSEEMFTDIADGNKLSLDTSRKEKHQDPNEPQIPVSAYGMFFLDTRAVIKDQNPHASFSEVSKIAASMWEGLDESQKNEYAKKTEAAKCEYLKARSAYSCSLTSKSTDDQPGMTQESDSASSPTAATPPPEEPLSPMQGGNPLLNSAMAEGSPPHGYMTLPPPQDKPSSHQQLPSTQLGSPTLFRQSHHHAEVQKHCRAQLVASGPVFVPVCKAGLIPKPSASLSSQAPGSSGDAMNHRRPLSAAASRKRCTRNGCPNPPVESHEWDGFSLKSVFLDVKEPPPPPVPYCRLSREKTGQG